MTLPAPGPRSLLRLLRRRFLLPGLAGLGGRRLGAGRPRGFRPGGGGRGGGRVVLLVRRVRHRGPLPLLGRVLERGGDRGRSFGGGGARALPLLPPLALRGPV